jgi:enamine deaminase RidA (YjgF/YER057c/UK114 family)
MPVLRAFVTVVVLTAFFGAMLPAQQQKKKPGSDDEGYIPVVAPENKSKKDKDETQSLPPAKELPGAVLADTDRLTFSVSPLSAKGLFTPQTRDALKTLLRASHGSIVKLRVFVAGSGDLRRVSELVAEAFTEKHQPLPALSVVQVGGLPLEGAQVVIESTETAKRSVNPNGVAFVAGQSGASVGQSLEKLKTVIEKAGLQPEDVLRVTCFVSSLDEQKDAHQRMEGSFPGAALNLAQLQREPVTPASECEAVARLRSARAEAVTFLNLVGDKSPYYSQIVLVNGPKLVLTGTQLAFGSQESDAKLAFDRLQKALSSMNARFDDVVMSHVYLTSSAMIAQVRKVRAVYYNGAHPPASTMLPFEGLPSLDAMFGVDLIAAPDSSSAQR